MRAMLRTHISFPILIYLAFVALQGFTSVAFAHKPITHVFLADVALADAVDDGKVTIYEVDYRTGQFKLDASGNRRVVGTYSVDQRILSALKNAPSQYRAGVIGPDGYPDLLTGQQIIHPAGRVTPGENDDDINPGGPGPNPWLEHLWEVAFENGPASDQTDKARAFVVGYLTHAAGDMYSHTFVNHYTGGAFHFSPSPENAIKHILLEGYVAERTPDPVFSASISGIEDFIYRQMTFGTQGTNLEKVLLQGDNAKFSIPAIFSRKYNWLTRDIDSYESKLQNINKKLDKLEDYEVTERLRLETEKQTHRITNGPRIDYYKRWRDDISSRLKQWPEVSHRVTTALMFNSSRKTDLDTAQNALEDYAVNHLLSMLGAPDALGGTIGFVNEWTERVVSEIGIPGLEEQIDRMKQDLYDYILEESFGISATELKKYLQDPVNQFDHVMNNPALSSGIRISRTDFDQNELHLSGDRFDYEMWPVAYNTVLMTKLLYLSQSEMNRLMEDLGSSERMTRPNAMLGYCETLDGKNQWKANAEKMVVARDGEAYRRIFMLQTGEDPARGGWSLGVLRYAIGPTGARLILVSPDSAAIDAGLKEKDVITHIDGKEMGSNDDESPVFRNALKASADGRIQVRYLRNGNSKTIDVQMKENK